MTRLTQDEDERFTLHLSCRGCGFTGVNQFGREDFIHRGKDREGFLYFECPRCREHLQFDSMLEYSKIQKLPGIGNLSRYYLNKTWVQILILGLVTLAGMLVLILRKR